MRIGIIGSGNIGGNAGKLLARAGHEVIFSYSRNPEKLEALAEEAGNDSRSGTPREAADFGDVVVLSVGWNRVDDALETIDDLSGKILIDTTNPYGPEGLEEPPGGTSAAEFNTHRVKDARLVKAYNTLTSGFQAEASSRPQAERAAMFYAGEDEEAKTILAGLIRDSGFEPVDVGGWAEVWIMEAPRRDGSVYGEEYRPEGAHEIVSALGRGDSDEAMRLAREYKVQE